MDGGCGINTGLGGLDCLFVTWKVCKGYCRGMIGYRAQKKFCAIRGEFGPYFGV